MKAAGFLSEKSALQQMGGIIDVRTLHAHTYQILIHAILGMNQSSPLFLSCPPTSVDRSEKRARGPGMRGRRDLTFCRQFSQRWISRFRAHNFRGTLAARSGTQGEDTGQRMRQGTQGVPCALGCRAVPAMGSAGAEIGDTSFATAATTCSRPGPQLGFCGWEGCRCWEGKHSQVPVRSEARSCIISHNFVISCSLIPAEQIPSEFVTAHKSVRAP